MGFHAGVRGVLLCAVVGGLGCRAEAPEPRFRDKSVASTPAQPAQARPQAPQQPQAPTPPPISRNPTSPDPVGGSFPLKQALEGLPAKGKLSATIETSQGKLECALYEDKAPLTVANFVGLARGIRPIWDTKTGAWVKRPLYDGTTFHRIIPDFMIQGGDHMGTGAGEVGYVVPDEIWPGSNHDRAGLLCMANRGPNTNGGQFFITDAAAPHLTAMRTYTIFGSCSPVEVIHKIAQVPKAFPGSERPQTPVTINKVTIARH